MASDGVADTAEWRLSRSGGYRFFDGLTDPGFCFGILLKISSAFDRVSCEVRHLLMSLRMARALSEFSFVDSGMP
jgi:hypothetical protein